MAYAYAALQMEFAIRQVTAAQAARVSELVHTSFLELAAADWEPRAQEAFLAESSAQATTDKLAAASYAAGAFAGERLIGFLLMPAPSLLGMLFVDPQSLRRGIARALWEHARAHVEAAFPAVKTVELNATPYALPFYRSIGFAPISSEFRREGSRATRMACWLPARALGAECDGSIGSRAAPATPSGRVSRRGGPQAVSGAAGDAPAGTPPASHRRAAERT